VPITPRGPRGVRARQPVQAGAAKIGSGGRLTVSANQAVQMMLAAWALRELTARRAARSHDQKKQPR
jgi:hypothetical protein